MKSNSNVTCDISTKKWLNLKEAILYLGFGSKNTFQMWRERGEISYYKPGNTILYKRSDLDKFIERHKREGFVDE